MAEENFLIGMMYTEHSGSDITLRQSTIHSEYFSLMVLF